MGQKHRTACYWSWLMHHTSSCQNFTSFPHGITRVTCEHLGYGKAIIIYESMIYMIYDIIDIMSPQPILLYAEWYWPNDTPCTPWDYLTRSNPSPRNNGRTTSWDKLGADDVVANGAPHAWNDGSECGLISAESADYHSPKPEPSYPANATQESLQFGTKSVWWWHSWHFPFPISHHLPSFLTVLYLATSEHHSPTWTRLHRLIERTQRDWHGRLHCRGSSNASRRCNECIKCHLCSHQ